MNRTVEQAITRSISHQEIVTIDLAHGLYDSQILADLQVACEDSVAANDARTEYWGTNEDGDEWRVHVIHGTADYAAPEGVIEAGRE